MESRKHPSLAGTVFISGFLLLSGFYFSASSTDSVFAQTAPQSSSKKETKKLNPTPEKLELNGMTYRSKLPANFPLPVYRRNVTKQSFMHSTAGTPSAAVTIETSDSPQEVFNWYRSAAKSAGWTVQAPSDDARKKLGGEHQMYYLKMQKKGHQAYVYCMQNPKGGTMINISWSIQ